MIERYIKAYKYIFIGCAVLSILGGVMEFLHIRVGISGKSYIWFILLFLVAYQSWFIAKLSVHYFNDKEKKQQTDNK